MTRPPLFVSEQDHAALVDELTECRRHTEERLYAQSRAIDLLSLTVRELEERLAALTIV